MQVRVGLQASPNTHELELELNSIRFKLIFFYLLEHK